MFYQNPLDNALEVSINGVKFKSGDLIGWDEQGNFIGKMRYD
jgi:hypothetical protein